MHNVFVIKRGDTSPTLRYLLPVDVSLAGAQVLFQMRKHQGETVIDATALIETVFAPAVMGYAWTPSDTDVAGRYQAEVQYYLRRRGNRDLSQPWLHRRVCR